MAATVGGHTEDVLCCEALGSELKLLVSGGEVVQLADRHRQTRPGPPPLPAFPPLPTPHPSLPGVQDGLICLTDLTTQQTVGRVQQRWGEAVTALCPSPAESHTLYASAGQSVLALDLRRGLSSAAVAGVVTVNQEEINSLAASAANGGWVAAGDDSGEVAVISLASFDAAAAAAAAGSVGSSGGGGSKGGGAGAGSSGGQPAYKTLRRGHSNICSAVAFRPHRPWELLSGGLDSCLVLWDFSRLRPKHSWNLGREAAGAGGEPQRRPPCRCVADCRRHRRRCCCFCRRVVGDTGRQCGLEATTCGRSYLLL